MAAAPAGTIFANTPTAEPVTDYPIAAGDRAPLVIGGVGGSGTRLVASLLQQMGIVMAGQMNEALDNLWFSALFIRRSIVLKPPRELDQLSWLFANAMRHGRAIPEELQPLVDEACRFDRGPALTRAVLEQACAGLRNATTPDDPTRPWGWKQPNSHVMVPQLNQRFTDMKYIYVVRNGLDMAFSGNQNQLKYFWGDLLLEGDTSPTPHNALRYWVAAYRRMLANRELLDDRLCILNFDQLCKAPRDQLAALATFAGLEPGAERLEQLAADIRAPGSTGRYLQQDCSSLAADDIEFVRQQGFPVEL